MRTEAFCLLGLILLTAPTAAQAQLRYRTNNNSITVVGYTGTDGDVTIPSTICEGRNRIPARRAV